MIDNYGSTTGENLLAPAVANGEIKLYDYNRCIWQDVVETSLAHLEARIKFFPNNTYNGYADWEQVEGISEVCPGVQTFQPTFAAHDPFPSYNVSTGWEPAYSPTVPYWCMPMPEYLSHNAIPGLISHFVQVFQDNDDLLKIGWNWIKVYRNFNTFPPKKLVMYPEPEAKWLDLNNETNIPLIIESNSIIFDDWSSGSSQMVDSGSATYLRMMGEQFEISGLSGVINSNLWTDFSSRYIAITFRIKMFSSDVNGEDRLEWSTTMRVLFGGFNLEGELPPADMPIWWDYS